MGNRDKEYDDRDDYDEDDEATEKAGSRCMCCDIKIGMAIGGVIIWGMAGLNVAYMIVTMQQGGSSFFTMVAGALMRNSSAYILWLIGFVVGLIGVLVPTVKHPLGLRQMAYLNLLACAVFCAIILYHGYTAAQDAYLMDALDQGRTALFRRIKNGLFKSKLAPKGDAAATIVTRLTELVIWQLIVVSTFSNHPYPFSISFPLVPRSSLPSSC